MGQAGLRETELAVLDLRRHVGTEPEMTSREVVCEEQQSPAEQRGWSWEPRWSSSPFFIENLSPEEGEAVLLACCLREHPGCK